MSYRNGLGVLAVSVVASACSVRAHVSPASATALSADGHHDGKPYVVRTTSGELRRIARYDRLVVVPKLPSAKSHEAGQDSLRGEPLETTTFSNNVTIREVDGRLRFDDGNRQLAVSVGEIDELRVSRRALYRGPLIAGVAVGTFVAGAFVASRVSGCAGGAGAASGDGLGCVFLTLNVGALLGGLTLLYTIPATSQLRD